MEEPPLTSWFQKLASVVDDVESVFLVAGVPMLAYGAHQVYAPAGWLVAGAVLVWVGLPTRPFPIVFGAQRKTKPE